MPADCCARPCAAGHVGWRSRRRRRRWLRWTFDPQEFIPHLLLRQGESPAPRLARTPIWLVERAEQGMQHPVLVHLGEEPAVGFESFQRLVEIVSTDADERDAARRRWKHYAGRGYELQRFDVGAAA